MWKRGGLSSSSCCECMSILLVCGAILMVPAPESCPFLLCHTLQPSLQATSPCPAQSTSSMNLSSIPALIDPTDGDPSC